MIHLIRTVSTRFVFAAAIIAALATAHSARAQAPAETAYVAVVKGNDVYVRCGGSEQFYPFTKVNDGDLVKVMGEQYEWARVVVIGPAFRDAYGYIKSSKGDAMKVRLSADGKTATTLGKVDIVAPNLDYKGAPGDSWKPVTRVEADQTLRVLESIDGSKDLILKVAMPAAAQGWINLQFLQKATDAQAKQFEQSLKAPPPVPAETPKAAESDKSAKKPVTKPETASSSESTKSAETTKQEDPETGEPTEASPSDSMGASDAAAKTAEAHAPAASQPEKPKGPPTLDDLEQAFKNLQKEPVESAELTPMRELYLAFADRSADKPALAARAKGRADQLQIWADAQKRRQDIIELQNRLKLSADETEAARLALERSAEYTAVGRVAASTIYDGKSLPKLLRLQDAATGRTLAYLQPDEKYELVNLVDKVVGVVGEKSYDGSMRLNIIAPKRIDVLNPQHSATASADSKAQ